eukprot:5209054-Pyramimonas_sp.AAC.1
MVANKCKLRLLEVDRLAAGSVLLLPEKQLSVLADERNGHIKSMEQELDLVDKWEKKYVKAEGEDSRAQRGARCFRLQDRWPQAHAL